MARCPVCDSVRIVIVVSPKRRAFCTACGARWVQEADLQRAIRAATPPLQPVGTPAEEPAS